MPEGRPGPHQEATAPTSSSSSWRRGRGHPRAGRSWPSSGPATTSASSAGRPALRDAPSTAGYADGAHRPGPVGLRAGPRNGATGHDPPAAGRHGAAASGPRPRPLRSRSPGGGGMNTSPSPHRSRLRRWRSSRALRAAREATRHEDLRAVVHEAEGGSPSRTSTSTTPGLAGRGPGGGDRGCAHRPRHPRRRPAHAPCRPCWATKAPDRGTGGLPVTRSSRRPRRAHVRLLRPVPKLLQGMPTVRINFLARNFAGVGTAARRHDPGRCALTRASFAQSSFATYALAKTNRMWSGARCVPRELLGPLGCGIQTGGRAVLTRCGPRRARGHRHLRRPLGGHGGAARRRRGRLHHDRGRRPQPGAAQHRHRARRHPHRRSQPGDPVEAIGEANRRLRCPDSLECTGIPRPRQPSTAWRCPAPGRLGVAPMGAEVSLDIFSLISGRRCGHHRGRHRPRRVHPRLITNLWRPGRFPVRPQTAATTSTRSNEAAAEDGEKGTTLKGVLSCPDNTASWYSSSRPRGRMWDCGPLPLHRRQPNCLPPRPLTEQVSGFWQKASAASHRRPGPRTSGMQAFHTRGHPTPWPSGGWKPPWSVPGFSAAKPTGR